MFKIDSEINKPSADKLLEKMQIEANKGIRLGDIEKLQGVFSEEAVKLKKYLEEIYGIYEPGSPKSVIGFMKRMKDPVIFQEAYKEGKWVSNKAVMKRLSALGYAFADDVIYYRKVVNAVNTLKSLKNNTSEDGLVRPKVNLLRTNRVQYREPNIVGIPNTLLKYVVRPREDGMDLYSVDIKNQEPFIVANVMNIRVMQDILKSGEGLYEKLFSLIYKPKATLFMHCIDGESTRSMKDSEFLDNEDISPVYYRPSRPLTQDVFYNGDRIVLMEKLNIAVGLEGKVEVPKSVRVQGESGEVYELPVDWGNLRIRNKRKEEIKTFKGDIIGLDVICTKEERKMFKVLWNAVMYGMSRVSTSSLFEGFHGEVVYDYIHGLSEVKKYKKEIRDSMKRGDSNEIHTYFGTAIKTDGSTSIRSLVDYPVQGTGADILALLVDHLEEEVKKRGLEGKLSVYYTRHDEIVLQVHQSVENVEDTLRDIFEHQIDDWEPFRVDIEKMEMVEMKVDRKEIAEEEDGEEE